MGGRVTRPAQSRDSLRADPLRKALDAGSPTGLIPPNISGAVQPSPLSWNVLDPNPTAGPGENVAASSPANSAELRRQLLEQLFENSPDALLIVDPSFRVYCANRQFQRLFGYSLEQILGQSIDSLILPHDHAAEAKWLAECVQRGEQLTLDTRRRHRDGALLEVSLTAAPLLIQGKTLGFYLLYRDISERKRSESVTSALYRIAEKSAAAGDLQQLFASVHGIVDELMPARNFSIALHDPESQLLSFPYFFDEYEAAPVPRKLAHGLVEYVLRMGDPLLTTPELLAQLQAQGELEPEASLAHPPLQWLVVPLQVNHHRFGALVVKNYSEATRLRDRDREVLTQISRQLSATLENKRNEQALRRSEVRYRSLVQTAVYGMYRSSLDGRFLDVNPALIGMLGYNSALEVLNLDPGQDIFIDPREYSSLVAEFKRTGRVDGFEARWKRQDGATITVRISGRAVATEDQPAEVLEAVAEDITERRLLEDQFRQAQKMEAVGRLSGGIAHDFNNLLGVIIGYGEILQEGLPAGHPLRRSADEVLAAGRRAAGLTRQLLAFSRQQVLEPRVLNSIVGDMESMLRRLIGEDVDLTSKLDPRLGTTKADPGQLEQVIMNLAVNARDAMPQGGKLIIETANTEMDELFVKRYPYPVQPGLYVRLTVSDTGTGMDPATQARIFEPFFTTKAKGQGTGLGLSMVYGVVKQSGGYIDVYSETGLGTTFKIYLPRVDEAAVPVSPEASIAKTLRGTETVLLVEDEAALRDLTSSVLQACGYTVLEAKNGGEALDISQHHEGQIHLLLTDVVMPGISGRVLADQLLQLRPQIKVVYMSGYTGQTVGAHGILDPGSLFLQKPFTREALGLKLRSALDEGRASEAASGAGA